MAQVKAERPHGSAAPAAGPLAAGPGYGSGSGACGGAEVRDSALTEMELRTLNAAAVPR
jgi:hypothetical protein